MKKSKLVIEVLWVELYDGTKEILLSRDYNSHSSIWSFFYVEKQSYFSCNWDQWIFFIDLKSNHFQSKGHSHVFLRFWLFCWNVILPAVKYNRNPSSVWSKTEVNCLDQIASVIFLYWFSTIFFYCLFPSTRKIPAWNAILDPAKSWPQVVYLIF